jgi:hypothetical protein
MNTRGTYDKLIGCTSAYLCTSGKSTKKFFDKSPKSKGGKMKWK